jgi:hypothetical protein
VVVVVLVVLVVPATKGLEVTPEAAKAIIFIALFTQEHETGPTWKELAAVLGWSDLSMRDRNRRIRRLSEFGVRWLREVERSLNCPKHIVKEAMQFAHELKEVREECTERS